MKNALRDNLEIDWNNMTEYNDTDDELDDLDRQARRSYVPYVPKIDEQPHTDFHTEIGFRKKKINLEDIMKLDLELISELAKARAVLPKNSLNQIHFF